MKNTGHLISFAIVMTVAWCALAPCLAAAQGAAQPIHDAAVEPSCLADEDGCFPDLPGTWQVRVDSRGGGVYGLSTAQSKVFVSKIDGLASMLRAAKVFNPPQGFKVEGNMEFCCSFECGLAGTCTTSPVIGRLWLRFLCFVKGRDGQPSTDPEIREETEISFNNPYDLWNGGGALKLADGRTVAFAPVDWRRVGGVTLYINQTTGPRYIFLTEGGRPLWIPVTREQYLRELIRQREADLAKDEADASPEAKAGLAQARAAMVDPLRAQLHSMSTEERASQAWVESPSDISPLAPANTGRPLVVYNPDYFDRSRPRTDIQLVTVFLSSLPEDTTGRPFESFHDVGKARLWEFVNEVDWLRVAAVMR